MLLRLINTRDQLELVAIATIPDLLKIKLKVQTLQTLQIVYVPQMALPYVEIIRPHILNQHQMRDHNTIRTEL